MDDHLKQQFLLLMAAVGCVFLSIFPGGDLLIYPVKLFVTYVHEVCHALAALLTGGSVHSITIEPDASGTTYTAGGIFWLISSAGYLGTTLIGLMSIHFLRSGVSGKAILTVFGLLTVVAIAESHSAFTLFWGIVIAAGLIAAYNSSRSTAALVASFISIQLLLNAFYDLKTLFILSGTGGSYRCS